jgi:hypothetical protein
MKYEGYTAGDWILISEEYNCTIQIGTAFVPAPYQDPHGRGECPQWRADGKLIADSPKLLAALVKIVEANAAGIEALQRNDANGRRDSVVRLAFAIAEAKKLIGGEA